MKKTTKNDDVLNQAIEEVISGRFAELVRYNRNVISKLEAQLENNAHQVIKAAAKEIKAVVQAHAAREYAKRVREEGSEEVRGQEGQVSVRIPDVAVLGTGYEKSVYSGLHSLEWSDRGVEGQVRSGQPEEDGSSSGAAQGSGYSDAVHAGQSDQQGQQD